MTAGFDRLMPDRVVGRVYSRLNPPPEGIPRVTKLVSGEPVEGLVIIEGYSTVTVFIDPKASGPFDPRD